MTPSKAATNRRYARTVKGRAASARYRERARLQNAHQCARPGCRALVASKQRGRDNQLCQACCAEIRASMLWGDDEGRTLPGLGVLR